MHIPVRTMLHSFIHQTDMRNVEYRAVIVTFLMGTSVRGFAVLAWKRKLLYSYIRYNWHPPTVFRPDETWWGTVADYPLGRVGSCLRPGMMRRPEISVWKNTFCDSWIFQTLSQSLWKEKW